MTDTKNLPLDEKRRLARELLARKRGEEPARGSDTPIAVIGIGCRYPGGAVDPDSFWRLMDDGVDAIRTVPRERWDADAWFDADPKAAGKINTRQGGFLDDVAGFDPRLFGLSPREAAHIDPQQRLLLETSWEALERAGIAPLSLVGSKTGVFVGLMMHDYEELRPGPDEFNGHVLLGTAASIASGRISYLLGLQGPSLTVDTACSVSLVSLHLACQSLRVGECDLALAGGVSLILTPTLHVEFARLHALSPDGRCKSFAAGADGVGWGEGCGMLALKRLDDAVRAGDPIWGVIRGSAVNQDGRSNGMTAPSGPAQEAVVRQALARSGITADEVDYVEAHGTGTPLGDPIEANALAAVYGAGRAAERPLRIGSVKSNIGHTLAAAGVAGVIKVLLALRHGRLPASLHAAALNTHVPWASVPLQVVREPVAWPPGARPRIAGVSSFGISGTNAHLLLCEPPSVERPPAEPPEPPALTAPILLSARTPEALAAQARQLAAHLAAHPAQPLADVAHTLVRGRTPLGARAALVASDPASLVRELHALADAPPVAPRVDQVAFLCTGQGAQYPGMGRALYRAFAPFRSAIDACARALIGELEQPLTDLLFGGGSLDDTQLTQPALFAIGVALAALWRSFGVRPQLLVGHSVGEYVAACVAGVFSIEDGARLVTARGRLMRALCAPGVMVAIEAPEAEVAPLVEPHREHVSIAAVNGPRQTVIAGREAEVASIARALTGAGVRSRRLAVSHAFHSPLMQPMLARFAEVAATVRYAPPAIPVVSNVTGQPGAELASADYWVRHVLAPVRFLDGVRALYAAGARAFVELGPQPTLLGMGAACLPEGEPLLWLPSLRKGQPETEVVLRAAGTLWARGAEVDLTEATAAGRRVELPTYPFERQRCWVDARTTARPVGGRSEHPLLGTRLPLSSGQAVFESLISREALSWLDDHRVFAQAVVPGAALVEWALAAARAQAGGADFTLRELLISRALTVPDDLPLRAQVLLTATETAGPLSVAIYTQPVTGTTEWTRHAEGRLEPAAGTPSAPRHETGGAPLAPPTLYAAFADAGLHYGPAFHAVRAAWRDDEGAIVAELALPQPLCAEADRYALHPVLLDAALHALALADGGLLRKELFLPVAFHDVQLAPGGAAAARVRGLLISRTGETIHATVTIWDAAGACIARIGRLECKRLTAADLRPRGGSDELLFTLGWPVLPPLAPAPVEPGGAFLLVAPAGLPPLGERLAERLRAQGARVETCTLDALPGALASLTGLTTLRAVVYFACGLGDGPAGARAHALAGLRVVQAVRAAAAPRLLFVTERGVAVRSGEAVSPAAATCWGLGRVALEEGTLASLALVDVEHFADAAPAEPLHAELLSPGGETQIALRAGQRHAARLQRAARADTQPPAWGVRDGSVLITGGLGGLGLAVARHLVQVHGARRLLLLGRSAPSGQAQQDIEALRAAGADITVVQADVTDRAALARAIDAAAPLRAVVHAAGAGEPVLLDQLTPAQLAGGLGAKIDGAWHLHELTRDLPLSAFVLFSSIAALAPDPGLGAYAAANAFLDGLAQHRRALGLVARSLDFGPWAGPGMFNLVAETERRRLLQTGIAPLSPEQGLAALDAAIAREEPQLAVLSLDLERRRRSYAGRPVPSLFRHLVRAEREAASGAGPGPGPELRARIDALAPAERQAALEQLVQQELTRALSLQPGTQVPPEQPLLDLGVDSLIGMELRGRLASGLGIELAATVIWDHRTVRALSAHLLSRLPASAPAAPAQASIPAQAPVPLPVSNPAPARRAPRLAALRLHPETPLPPLFGIGGVLGGGTYLRDLALELGPLQPFYTMSYPGLEDDGEPLTRVEALADHFIDLLRGAHPSGPYVLLGHSFGGVVAFEMAQRLVAQGHDVRELILLDTWTKATIAQKKVAETGPQLDALLAPFRAAGRLPDDIDTYKQRFERIWQANAEASAHYQMQRFEGDVTLIVPEDDLFGLSPNVEDWRRFCSTLKVRRTSGNHATMALPPNARRTAQIIRGLLRGSERPAMDTPPAPPVPEPPPVPAPPASDTTAPLSRSQRWMWLLHQLDKESPTYNVFFGLRAHGSLRPERITHALAQIAARHQALRMSIADDGGEPRAVIQAALPPALSVHDLRALDGEARAARIDTLRSEILGTPFDLTRAPLFRVALIELGPDETLLWFCFHHAIADGLSVPLFTRELLACYDADARGTQPILPALPWQLADHARWERTHLTEARLDAQRTYWRRTLHALPELQLPVDHRVKVRSGRGGVVGFELAPAPTRALKELAQATGCSLYMVLAAGFAALLARHAGQDDLAIATAVSSRTRPEVRDLIGCFVSTLLLRFDLTDAPTVTEHLQRVRARTVEALAHQDLPFDEVARLVAPERPAGAPLARACFVFEKLPAPASAPGPADDRADAIRWEIVRDTVSGDVAGTAKFDLSLSMEESGERLCGSFLYASDVFDAETVRRMAGHLTTLLTALPEDAQRKLTALPLLTDAERQQILVDWNDTARLRPGTPRLHELFEAHARRDPARTAVVHRGRTLTYGELDARAAALAAHLRGLGVEREVCVGLCTERTPEMVVAMLAILKAGGAYVPLDPAYPRDRLRFMLDDSGARVLAGSAACLPALGELAGRRFVDIERPETWRERDDSAPQGASPGDLAYLIYTSGSTGTPKAVAIEHASAVELVRWAQEVYPPEVLAGVLASTSICFDLSVFELFVPLGTGGRVVLVRDALALAEPDAPADVRLINTVPSAAAELLRLRAIPASVRVVNLAGEPLPQALVEALYDGTHAARVYDLYGPSEDTTYSTFALRARGGTATIGRPITNTRAYVLDAERQPVPVGVAGEICLAGAGLARGYLGRPALTAERFVPDPFGRPSTPGARMYRTGDLGRFRADGSIEFLGRADGQIKLRGFRIELGEIEAALRGTGTVADCAVTVSVDGGPGGPGGDARLVAYVVGHAGIALQPAELRAALARTLPHFMLPQHLLILDALPRTQNGKLDRKRLPAPEAPAPDAVHVPPAPGLEETLAATWREVLGVDRIGRDDHFFALGGHSLLATRVASRLTERLGRAVTPVALFRHPVLRDLAQHLGGDERPRPAGAAVQAVAAQKQAIQQLGRKLGKQPGAEKRK